MLLALDIGNTNVTLGLVRDAATMATRRAVTRAGATPDELEVQLDELLRLEGLTLDAIGALSLASVVPALTGAVRTIARRRGIELHVWDAATIPVRIRVERPAEVGADRLVNAYAARELHGAPAIVLDFGTATTFDVVASDGAYVGGAIAPGLELGLDALAARTAKLPRIELRAPDRVIGTDTASAIQAGAVIGYQALATGLLERTRSELAATEGLDPRRIRAILTGGLSAAPWAAGIAGVDVIDPDLTLRGLALLVSRPAEGTPPRNADRPAAAVSR